MEVHVRRPFLASAAGTALVLAMIAVRHTFHPGLDGLWVNLVLAWIPVLLGALAARHPALLLVLGPVWLAFLPNAFYLLTDVVHIGHHRGVPPWFDAAMLGGMGALGLCLGAVSLRQVADAVGAALGRPFALAVYATVPALCGFALYLGRVERFNSWDLALRPLAVLEDVIALFARPAHHPEAWAVTATFAAVCYAAAVFVPPAPPQHDPGGHGGVDLRR
jgi:uncharacterized membrane protein